MFKAQPLDASTLRAALRFHLDRGETLESIGDAFGVTLWTVFNWVHGKRNQSRQTLTQAAYVLAQAYAAAPGLPSISRLSAGDRPGNGLVATAPARKTR